MIHYFHFPFLDTLGPSDLRCVRSAIFSVRHKWYDIGLELDIPFQTLDVIRTDFHMAAECLIEMLKQWLSRTLPAPSWSSLVEALSSEPVGEKRLADGIHGKYCAPCDEQDGENVDSEAAGMCV